MRNLLETDVVVVGFGGAGASAAISASDSGARVIILEKSQKGGGNTAVSLGRFVYALDEKACYAYVRGLVAKSGQEYDRKLLRTYANGLVQNATWIKHQGGKILIYSDASFPEISGASGIKRAIVEGGMWPFLSAAVKRRGITVLNNTRAKDLITDSSGQVIGVTAKKSNRNITVLARQGVVLATGGFEYNEKMKHDWLKGSNYYPVGSSANTGDGIEMARRLGAPLWHMNVMTCALAFRDPKTASMFIVRLDRGLHVFDKKGELQVSFAFVLVDQTGRRFVNESSVEYHNWNLAVDQLDPAELRYPRIPCYLIFDEKTRRMGAIAHGTSTKYREPKWSEDNMSEIRKGWISRASTLEELANKTGLNTQILSHTIDEYNKACENSLDLEFKRVKIEFLNESPYYAIKLWPALENTQGGPRRNSDSRVLGTNQKPIKRLYSAGELGSLWSHIYQGGGNIGECLVFGRIAGANAASELPLSFRDLKGITRRSFRN